MADKQVLEELETLVKDNEVLRRCLVKVTFAGSGAHKRLDAALANLRQQIKSGQSVAVIQQQVDVVADVLRDLEETSAADMDPETLRKALEHELCQEWPEKEKDIRRLFQRKRKEDFLALLRGLARLTGEGAEKRPASFWGRLFGSKADDQQKAKTEALLPEEDLRQLKASLLAMVERIESPQDMRPSLESLLLEVEALHDLEALPPLMNQVADFVIEATSVDHERFQQFLSHLGKRLVMMANLVESGVQLRDQRTEAATTLDLQVRSHVQEMQSGVREARTLPDLQKVIEAQLDKVMSSLNRFRSLDSDVREKEVEQTALLRKRLQESQAAMQRLREELEKQKKIAETDPLTQVANRHKFDQALQQEYNRWRRYRHPLALVLLDLDHFKQVNDKYGHTIGDAVLKETARRLVDNVRNADLVARFGGEEFVILMPETNLTDATKAANKIRRAIAAEPVQTDSGPVTVTVSMGVAEFEHEDTPEDVLQRADAALYRAKRKGRNQVCCELAEGLSP